MTQVRFQLVEETTGQRMDVLYQNSAEPVSANFTSATDVRALGIYDPQGHVFRAAQLQTKCPSKDTTPAITRLSRLPPQAPARKTAWH